MISFYDSVYDKAMTQSINDQDKTKAAASVLKVFHETVCIRKYIFHIQYNFIQITVHMSPESVVPGSKSAPVFIPL